MPRRYAGGRFHPQGAATLLTLRRLDRETSSEVTRLVLLRGEDTLEFHTQAQPITMNVPYASCPGLISPPAQPPLFAPKLNWSARADTTFVAATTQYTIDRYHGTHLSASWRRAVAPLKATPELARQELGGGTEWTWGGGKCRLDPEEEITVRGVAEYIPAVDDLALAPDGSVWVRRAGVGGEPVLIDVLSPTGEYLGTLQANSPFPVAFLSTDTLLAIGADSDDVPQLLIYRIVVPP